MTRKNQDDANSVREIDMILPRAWDDMSVEKRREWMGENLKQREILLAAIDELDGIDFEFSQPGKRLDKAELLDFYEYTTEVDR